MHGGLGYDQFLTVVHVLRVFLFHASLITSKYDFPHTVITAQYTDLNVDLASDREYSPI